MDLEKLKREEEAAVEMLYGKQPNVEVETPTMEVNDDDFVETLPTDESNTEEASSEIDNQEEPEKSNRNSWKKRFTTFKASADNTMFEQRKTIAYQNNKIATLEDKITDLDKNMRTLSLQLKSKVDPFKDVFTVEDEETIGSEAVEIIKKAMKVKGVDNEAVDRLEAQLAELKKEKTNALKKDYEDFKVKSFEDLKVKLTSLVPEWTTVDTEPQFGEFVKEIDPVSGSLRSKLFANAIENGDVYNVARFYKEYQALKPRSKEQILAAKVTPVGGGSDTGSTPTEKKRYSVREYSQFMDDVARGKWRDRPKEAKIKEKQYDLAYAQGRMVG